MKVVWLETSAVIGLTFSGKAMAEEEKKPLTGVEWKVSRYVLFELGRGYLSYFIKMHNESLNCVKLWQLHERSYTGQRRHRGYERSAWLQGFTSYLDRMEENREGPWGLEDLREQLWTKIRRGWRKSMKHYQAEGGCPCRADLPPPTREELNHPIVQILPMRDCGKAGSCGLMGYLREHAGDFEAMLMAEERLPSGDVKEKERQRRRKALRCLLAQTRNTFNKGQCYSSADAIIAHEARHGFLMTRDGDYKALCGALESDREPFPE